MFRILFILSFLSATPAARAELRLTPRQTSGFALRQNPSLAAARLRIEEARGRLENSGRLRNPEVEGAFMQNVREPERSVELGISQQFPLTARLRLERDVSRAELAAAIAEVRDQERKIAGTAQTLATRVLAVDGQRALRKRQLTNSNELATFTRQRVETGEASVTDATLLELESSQLETELVQLEVERATPLGELRALLGVGPAQPVTVVGELPPPGRLPSPAASATNRPDMLAARANTTASLSAVSLARAQKWDDIRVGLSLTREREEDAPEGYTTDHFLGLRFSLPLPVWNDNSGKVREASAVAVRRAREVDALSIEIRAEMATARSEMQALADLVRSIETTLLPKASLVEEQLRLSQSTGQVPLGEVLRARDRRLQLERQRLDTLRDYHLARIRHEIASGEILGKSERANSK